MCCGIGGIELAWPMKCGLVCMLDLRCPFDLGGKLTNGISTSGSRGHGSTLILKEPRVLFGVNKA